ncbi:MAG: 23S rRNA (adenine(2503)-C(2))-methyltransferase RlmN [Clostridia bacterium]|nr:23S rRNA (adenine(2503)-C(2))-methyltransferase RlmN [Clostridia bacterium]
MTDNKIDLLGLTKKELEDFFLSIGEPKYRAKQLFTQMHKGLAPDEITNFSAATKKKIAEAAYCHFPTVAKKLVSAIDGTVKYLFRLSDGNCVESVVMRYEHGITICISTQVGCRMGCRFCASTIDGKVRDLAPSELLGQIIAASRDLGERIGGIVMMGIGEPLDNYDNVIKFLRLVGEEDGVNIGYRHISLSTCGLVDKIYELAKEDLPITLSISLHAADDATRSEIMPINKRYPIGELLDACRDYFAATKRRISFEYTLIAGKNDSPETAQRLAELLNGKLRSRTETMPIHVNLIPVNEVKERDFTHSDKKAVARFADILEKRGIRATVRRKLGADINASCGQLRRAEAKNTEGTT